MIITFSPSVSKADVASSNSNIFGFRIKARAMAMHCFCPPERWLPLGPTFVLYPCECILSVHNSEQCN